jgi:hypothetical protein
LHSVKDVATEANQISVGEADVRDIEWPRRDENCIKVESVAKGSIVEPSSTQITELQIEASKDTTDDQTVIKVKKSKQILEYLESIETSYQDYARRSKLYD